MAFSALTALPRAVFLAASLTQMCGGVSQVWTTGANFLQAGAAHPASGDILLLTDPFDKDVVPNKTQSPPVSVALIPRGSQPGASFASLTVVDNGSAVALPVDVAFIGSTAFIVDQGVPGIVAFNRTSSGAWHLWKKWLLSELLPSCDAKGRQYGQPEAIAAGPEGELYVSLAVMYGKPCFLRPFDRCCAKVVSSSVVMQLDFSNGNATTLREVFYSRSFFNYVDGGSKIDGGFHIRAIDVTQAGDIVVAGYGDDMTYFGHSAWLWKKKTQEAVCMAGQASGQGGKGGDGGNATKALMNLPWGIAATPEALYISEAGNSDVRKVVQGIISIESEAPHGEAFENDYFRKLHRGPGSGKLLLAISGLGSDSGRLVEVDVDKRELAFVV